MFSPLRMQAVQSPVIPIVGEMARARPGVISLGQGVVYYGPPETISARIEQFFASPTSHRYGPVEGIPELLEALRGKLARENSIRVDAGAGLLVSAGGNMAFMNAVLAITDPGDEVLLLTPYYFNHHMAIAMAGCRPVPVPTDEHFQPIPDAIERAITRRTRAVITVSPNNPSGAVYPEAAMRAINEICALRGIFHIHDEAYEYFTYGGAQHFSPASIPGSHTHTISLFSFSKSYGLAGWRMGYMVFPASLTNSIKKIQDTILICPPLISQYAALGALDAGRDYCDKKQQVISEARTTALLALQELSDICDTPAAEGAFYLLIRVRTELSPMELVKRLIEQYGVALMPGDAFGLTDGCSLRIAYGALQPGATAEAVHRLTTGLRALAR
ncbi:MAG TPA: pyridoxal phosphate-dependent aminotransferase [Armatimonadota bacterium]|nr:pyridoxal phosphate-dependent aminotransferase [Armatimonadota bacterium]